MSGVNLWAEKRGADECGCRRGGANSSGDGECITRGTRTKRVSRLRGRRAEKTNGDRQNERVREANGEKNRTRDRTNESMNEQRQDEGRERGREREPNIWGGDRARETGRVEAYRDLADYAAVAVAENETSD